MIQKYLITNFIKIKATTPYEIILAEVGMFPLEGTIMIKQLCYLQKVEIMKTTDGLE